MRRTIAVLALAIFAAVGPVRAVARGHAKAHESRPTILGDGLYTIADRSIACRVNAQRVACANAWLTIVCSSKECQAREMSNYPRELWVEAKDAKRPDARVLAPHSYADFAYLSCSVRRRYVDCVVSDYGGGFQMSGIFDRVVTLDLTPSPTWPWDGKSYSRKDLPKGQALLLHSGPWPS